MRSIKDFIMFCLGHTKWLGLGHPCWLAYNQKQTQLTGLNFQIIQRHLIPGDLLITRTEGFLSNAFIPGWWSHAGICTEVNKITDATSKGVMENYLFDFLKTVDHAIILRPKMQIYAYEAVTRGLACLGYEYDYDFDFKDTKKFACTEFVAYCYPDLLTTRRKIIGREVLVADDIVSNENFEKVYQA